MAEPAKIALVPMMILDHNGNYQTVYAPQSLASLGVSTPGAPPMMPMAAPQGMQNYIPTHAKAVAEPPPQQPKESSAKGQASPRPPKEGSKQKAGTKIYVSNLPAGMKDAEFKALFSEHGPIVKATLVKRRRTTTFGFMQFASRELAQAAINDKNGTQFEGRTLSVQFADGEKDSTPPTKVVKVSNLPQAATKAEIEAIFGRFGALTLCHVEAVRGRSVTAIIEYANIADAAGAQETLHCLCIPNQDAPLEVEFLKGVPEWPVWAPAEAAEGEAAPAKREEEPYDPTDAYCESPTSQLFLRGSGALAPELEVDMAGAHEADAAAMLPLAQYIEHMMQHYQLEAPSMLEEQHPGGTPSSSSTASGTSSSSWEHTGPFQMGYSEVTPSESSPAPGAPAAEPSSSSVPSDVPPAAPEGGPPAP